MPLSQAEVGPLIALTGASGFVGRHLVRELATRGNRVRILTRRDPVNQAWRDVDLEVVPGTLGDVAALRELVTGADAVVHLAGLIKAVNTAQFMAVNRDATRALAQATQRYAPHAQFLQVSSLAAREPTLSAYAASKAAGEQAALEVLGRQATVLRPPAVYGPGDLETLIFFQLAEYRTVWVPGNPAARMALIHVGDLVTAIADLLASTPTGAIFAVADAQPAGYRWQEILAAAARAVGNHNPRFRRLPRWPLVLAARCGDLGRRLGYPKMLNTEKLRELLHQDWSLSAAEQAESPKFSPRYDLAAGFGTAVAWYRQTGWLADRDRS